MRFVRTKDGKISFLDTEPYEDEPNYVVITSKGKMNLYRPDEVIKQANTIEELCDYCLYYNCYGDFVIRKMPLSTSLESLYRDMQDKMVKDIKLAIKTDKGIIYVAKMNNKGALELL